MPLERVYVKPASMDPSSLVHTLAPIGMNPGHLGHGQRDRVVGGDNQDRLGAAPSETAQKAPPIRGGHLELARRFDHRNLVPLEHDRPCIVGLEFQPAAIQLHDLAGVPVAVGQRDHIGPLGPRGAPGTSRIARTMTAVRTRVTGGQSTSTAHGRAGQLRDVGLQVR